MQHEEHNDEQHNQMPFEILSLITFSKNLELVLHAFFTNKMKALYIHLILKKILRVPDQNGVSQA